MNYRRSLISLILITLLTVVPTALAYGETVANQNNEINILHEKSVENNIEIENDGTESPDNNSLEVGTVEDENSISDSDSETQEEDKNENEEKDDKKEDDKKTNDKSTGLKSPLLKTAKKDKNYKKRVLHLSEKERKLAERLVYGEAGHHGFKSMCLVAQCLKDACFAAKTDSIEKIRKMYRYNASVKKSSKLSQKAVKFIFEEGGYAVKHRILYFYLPRQGRSPWHETMNFIVEYRGLRFFDRK